jgi:hypothetical protein
MTGVAKNTIQKLTRELGEAVMQYHDNVVRNVRSQGRLDKHQPPPRRAGTSETQSPNYMLFLTWLHSSMRKWIINR